ncbi:MAG: hypothetical protein ACKOWF_15570 [Chloroflexota bacterium]
MAPVDRRAPARRTPWWRTALSWLLLLIFCVTAPLAIIAGWARYNLVDESRFVETLAPLAKDTRVREVIVDAVERALGIEPAADIEARAAGQAGARHGGGFALDLPALLGIQVAAAATPEPAVKRAGTTPPPAVVSPTAARPAAPPTPSPSPAATASPAPSPTPKAMPSPSPEAAAPQATAAPTREAEPVAAASPAAAEGDGTPSLAGVERELVGEAVDEALDSPEFARAWELASKKSFAALTAAEEGAGPVYLDLSGAAARIQQDLSGLGIPGIDQVAIAPETFSIEVLDADAATAVRTALRRIQALGLALPIIAGVALIGSLWAAGNKLRALRRAGFGLALATIIMLLALLIGQQGAVSRLGSGDMAGAAQAVIDAVLRMPALWSLAAIVAGLAVALFAGMLGWMRGR